MVDEPPPPEELDLLPACASNELSCPNLLAEAAVTSNSQPESRRVYRAG